MESQWQLIASWWSLQTKGKPTHPHNSEKAGIEEDDDEYAGPSSLQYDAFHDGGRGE